MEVLRNLTIGEVLSEDKNESQQNEVVDIESMKVTILMIVKNKSQFGSVVGFLNRRDWNCIVTSQMNEAIASISKDQPDFVFISFNHPNQKFQKLPSILAAGFNTTCVGFCEAPDLITESRLTASKIQYKLVGAASGPSIYRRVKQILAEIHGIDDGQESTKVSGLNTGANTSGSDGANTTRSSSTMNFQNDTQHVAGKSGDNKSKLAYIPDYKGQKPQSDKMDILKQLQSALSEDSEESDTNFIGGDKDSVSHKPSHYSPENKEEANHLTGEQNDKNNRNHVSGGSTNKSGMNMQQGEGYEKPGMSFTEGENKKGSFNPQTSDEHARASLNFQPGGPLGKNGMSHTQGEGFDKGQFNPSAGAGQQGSYDPQTGNSENKNSLNL
ncbi:MAG: hypothetical protein KDD40_04855, partial [Bdellovibrionales bacterium]|nr:hypothetical protein [Bdellovibrionales bacterium]